MTPTRVLIWNEYRNEHLKPEAAKLYPLPGGIHEALAAPLRKASDLSVRTATLDDPDQGLSDPALAETDVLVFWAHRAHDEVTDETAARVQKRVLEGMGVVFLHSAHGSKPFTRLLGTSGTLKWRMANDRERLWNVAPGHPITEGIPDQFTLANEEMYGEPFGIPPPDELIFISWFTGGEVFRSGCTWTRGAGRVFYFRPGHETVPTFHDPNVQRVILNGVRWARPHGRWKQENVKSPPLE